MQLKDFVKLKLLGKGSFGSVYKVRYTQTNETLALKEMNIKPMSTLERKTALNEVRLLASIAHPNIIEYKFSFLEDGRLYIVTELAEGGDVDHLIRKQQQSQKYMEEDLLWSFIAQICSGLQALHKHGIVHRDMKSSNILICQRGVLKLADFGVAKIMKGAEYVHTSIGTPYYLSPEQWKDQPYNEKTDMWSLGVVLYEMTALRLPFQGVNMNELSRNVTTGTFPRLPSHFSPELQNIITRLLVKNPKVRPSADEILQLPIIKTKLLETQRDVQVSLIDTIALPRRMSIENIEFPRPSRMPSPKPQPHNDGNTRAEKEKGHRGDDGGAQEELKAPLSAPSGDRLPAKRPQPPELGRPPIQNQPDGGMPLYRNKVAAAREDLKKAEIKIYGGIDGYSRQYGVLPSHADSSRPGQADDGRVPNSRNQYHEIIRPSSIFPSPHSGLATPASIYSGDHRRRKHEYNPTQIGPNRLF